MDEMVCVSKSHTVYNSQELATMQLIDLILNVLDSGVLTMAAERRMQQLLKTTALQMTEVTLLEQLIDALNTGKVRAIA